MRLAISDNGPGVAAADLSRILQPFEHAGRVADHAKGAGLGLTLVKAFAELHGGRLVVESHAGEGFKAVIVLPATSPHSGFAGPQRPVKFAFTSKTP